MSATPPQTMDESGNVPTCRLLKLPAELRNSIYRLVLVRSGSKIRVNSNGYKRPGLLNASKQIRSEALQIFYCENGFSVDMLGCNSDLLVTMDVMLKALRLNMTTVKVAPDVGRVHQIRWKHLKIWAERIYAKQLVSPKGSAITLFKAQRDSAWVALAEVLWTAARLKELEWEVVEELLEQKAALLQMLFPGWFLQ